MTDEHKKSARDNLADVHQTAEKIKGDIERVMNIPKNNVAGTNIVDAKKREQQEQALDAVKKASEETEQLGKRLGIDVKGPTPTSQEPASPDPAPTNTSPSRPS